MKSGVYQMSFRGLTVAEVWRFAGEPLKFVIGLVLKLVAFKGPLQRLPAHEAEIPCREEDLSDDAKHELLPMVGVARELGYTDGRFYTLSEKLDPATKEAFSYLGLHQDRSRIAFIGYILNVANDTTTKQISVTGSVDTGEFSCIEFVDHRNYLDGLPGTKVIKVKGKGVAAVHHSLTEYTAGNSVRMHGSFDEMKRRADEYNLMLFDSHIARGLYVLKQEGSISRPPPLVR